MGGDVREPSFAGADAFAAQVDGDAPENRVPSHEREGMEYMQTLLVPVGELRGRLVGTRAAAIAPQPVERDCNPTLTRRPRPRHSAG